MGKPPFVGLYEMSIYRKAAHQKRTSAPPERTKHYHPRRTAETRG
jgi:hypothetical protein